MPTGTRPETVNKGGRPRNLSDEQLSEAAGWVAEGRETAAIARVLGVSEYILRKRLAEIKDATATSRNVAEALEIDDEAPIAALAHLAGEGITNRLYRAGFTTVGSVREASNEQLLAAEGIGTMVVTRIRKLGVGR